MEKFRMMPQSIGWDSHKKAMWDYISSLHSQMRIGNNVLEGYEKKIAELEEQKYPPMDRIKDLPEVPLEDLPFN